MPLPHDRASDGESARAYHAFSSYRDLDPEVRSLDAAWRNKLAAAGKPTRSPGARHPSHWHVWSTRFSWVERVAAHDAEVEALRQTARADRIRKLENQRVDFEYRNQKRLEERVAKMEAVLAKADAAPITDVTQKKTEFVGRKPVDSSVKIKGINFAGYAALVKATNDTARQAIIGVRDLKVEEESSAEREVQGLLWRGAAPAAEPV